MQGYRIQRLQDTGCKHMPHSRVAPRGPADSKVKIESNQIKSNVRLRVKAMCYKNFHRLAINSSTSDDVELGLGPVPLWSLEKKGKDSSTIAKVQNHAALRGYHSACFGIRAHVRVMTRRRGITCVTHIHKPATKPAIPLSYISHHS